MFSRRRPLCGEFEDSVVGGVLGFKKAEAFAGGLLGEVLKGDQAVLSKQRRRVVKRGRWAAFVGGLTRSLTLAASGASVKRAATIAPVTLVFSQRRNSGVQPRCAVDETAVISRVC